MIGFLTLLLVVLALVSSLTDSDVSEKNQHEVIFKLQNKPIGLDFDWFGSIDKWYVPIWSKLHSYRTARNLLLKDNLSEDELKNSCIVFNIRDGSFGGFGRLAHFEPKLCPESKSFSFISPWKKITGRYSLKLTDNTTFALGVASWQDGQISWAVLSAQPTMNDRIKNKILNFIKYIGFNEKLAVENNYENCVNAQEDSNVNIEL